MEKTWGYIGIRDIYTPKNGESDGQNWKIKWKLRSLGI